MFEWLVIQWDEFSFVFILVKELISFLFWSDQFWLLLCKGLKVFWLVHLIGDFCLIWNAKRLLRFIKKPLNVHKLTLRKSKWYHKIVYFKRDWVVLVSIRCNRYSVFFFNYKEILLFLAIQIYLFILIITWIIKETIIYKVHIAIYFKSNEMNIVYVHESYSIYYSKHDNVNPLEIWGILK